MKQPREYDPVEFKRRNPTSHFLDSGAFSLWGKAKEYARKTGVSGMTAPDSFYDTIEYFNYLSEYAAFVKRYAIAIDLYANVDVIGSEKLTWRNQQYLEDVGLRPVPVVHYDPGNPGDISWLKHYVKREYPLIGLGGLVGSSRKEACRKWIDKCFDYVCTTKNRLPRVKLHGFGITNYELLIRYPWYSVDSATWTKVAAFGGILVPRMDSGHFSFLRPPYIIKVSNDSGNQFKFNYHWNGCPPQAKRVVRAWLDDLGVQLGHGTVFGVRNHHTERKQANVLFFERMRKAIPGYPWSFLPYTKTDGKRVHPPRGFDFFKSRDEQEDLLVTPRKVAPTPIIIYYSGQGNHGDPEITLGDNQANIMLTYWDSREKMDKRFRAVYKNRRKASIC